MPMTINMDHIPHMHFYRKVHTMTGRMLTAEENPCTFNFINGETVCEDLFTFELIPENELFTISDRNQVFERVVGRDSYRCYVCDGLESEHYAQCDWAPGTQYFVPPSNPEESDYIYTQTVSVPIIFLLAGKLMIYIR